MAVGPQDQQLVLHEIFPAVREVRDQDEGENGKGLHPRSDVLDALPLFFPLGFAKVETKEGTTILKGKAGLPCCESPVPAAKKLEAELPSDDETPPKQEFTIETETDE